MHNLPVPTSKNAILPWEQDLHIEPVDKDCPSISIVVPIFNAGAFIEKTIRSLLCNDLSGVELILMDGGSTDSTMEIVNYYGKFFTVIHSAPDDGQSDAINRGFKKASNEILYWLNGDDLVLPNTLKRARGYFRDNSSCDVLVGNAFMTELDLSPINHFVFSPEKLKFDFLLDYASNHLVQPSVFFTRKAWGTCGPVNNDYHYAMDADLFIGMAREYTLHHLDLDIAYSVYHEGCKTRDARAESIAELALVQAGHGGLSQAQKTLNILIELHNELQEKKTPSVTTHADCLTCKVLEARLNELNKTLEENKRIYLEIDMLGEA